MAEHVFLNGRVSVLVGDITQQQVDAVVNAANLTLLGGGGGWTVRFIEPADPKFWLNARSYATRAMPMVCPQAKRS